GFEVRLLFLHLLFHLLAAFRAEFGALFATFVENLLRADQLDEGFLAAIAFAKASADDSQIPAAAIAVTRSYFGEESIDGFTRGEKRRCGTASSNIAALAEGDHLLDVRTHGLRFSDRRLD